ANWNPAGAPQSGEDLAFPAGAPQRTSTNDLTGRTFGFILFNGPNSDYELFGNGIILSGGLSSVSTAPLTKSPNLNLDITLAQDLRFVADDGGLGATRGVVLAGHTLTLNTTTSNALVALEGVISGVGDVVKVGVGQALFGGPNGNTYQGTLSITESIMLLSKSNSNNGLAMPGNLVIGSPIDPFGFTDPFVFNKVIMVNENMIASSNKITINHESINQNGFDQVIGPLELYNNSINTNNTMLTMTTTISQPHWFFTRYPFINGHLSLPFDTTFDLHQPGHLYIGATISGAGGITQQGSGSMELFNTNDFTGAVTVNGGLLWVAESTQALGQNAVVTLNQDGILGLDTVTIA
ncbi:MAG TPA: hypothetical protein VNM37_11280, partial [Candidatus Dormibacteraeota bacterium]|nr:hypothetical protein [Candidatus Dormibacteraeota bacterium]